MNKQKHSTIEQDDPPPFLRSWNNVYLAVLILHALLIFLFWWFTNHYS